MSDNPAPLPVDSESAPEPAPIPDAMPPIVPFIIRESDVRVPELPPVPEPIPAPESPERVPTLDSPTRLRLFLGSNPDVVPLNTVL